MLKIEDYYRLTGQVGGESLLQAMRGGCALGGELPLPERPAPLTSPCAFPNLVNTSRADVFARHQRGISELRNRQAAGGCARVLAWAASVPWRPST